LAQYDINITGLAAGESEDFDDAFDDQAVACGFRRRSRCADTGVEMIFESILECSA
jgi:hypothetical protein